MIALAAKLRPAPRLRLGPARADDAAAMGAILSDWVDETDWMVRVRSRADEARLARDPSVASSISTP